MRLLTIKVSEIKGGNDAGKWKAVASFKPSTCDKWEDVSQPYMRTWHASKSMLFAVIRAGMLARSASRHARRTPSPNCIG